jgi:hypothetical protein
MIMETDNSRPIRAQMPKLVPRKEGSVMIAPYSEGSHKDYHGIEFHCIHRFDSSMPRGNAAAGMHLPYGKLFHLQFPRVAGKSSNP